MSQVQSALKIREAEIKCSICGSNFVTKIFPDRTYNCKKTPFSQNGVQLTSNYTLPRPDGKNKKRVSLQVCKLVKKTADFQSTEVYKGGNFFGKISSGKGKKFEYWECDKCYRMA